VKNGQRVVATRLGLKGVLVALAYIWTVWTPKAVVQRPIYPFAEAETLMLSCTSAHRAVNPAIFLSKPSAALHNFDPHVCFDWGHRSAKRSPFNGKTLDGTS